MKQGRHITIFVIVVTAAIALLMAIGLSSRGSDARQVMAEEVNEFPAASLIAEDSDLMQRGTVSSFSVWKLTTETAARVTETTPFRDCRSLTCSKGFVDAASIEFKGIPDSSSNSSTQLVDAMKQSMRQPYRCAYRVDGSLGVGTYRHLDMWCVDPASGQTTYRHIIK